MREDRPACEAIIDPVRECWSSMQTLTAIAAQRSSDHFGIRRIDAMRVSCAGVLEALISVVM
jgi:hypothetical protein